MSEEGKFPKLSSKSHLNVLSIDTLIPQTSCIKWEELRTPGKHPSRRSYHSAVEWDKNMLIYGGQDIREGVIAELWMLNLTQGNEHWEEIKCVNDPGPLCRHIAVVHEDNMYVVGGTNFKNEGSGLHILDLKNMVWTNSRLNKNELPAVDSHTGVLYSLDNTYILIFGGFISGTRSNHIYRLNLNNLEWDSPSDENLKPCPRAGHSAVSYNSSMYVFGGCNEDNDRLHDLWRLNLNNFQWDQISMHDEVPARSGHSVVVHQDTMIVFGGMKDLIKETNDMYTLNLNTHIWTLVQNSKQIEDPISREQFEEFKRTRASPRKVQSPCSEQSPDKRSLGYFDFSGKSNDPLLRNVDYAISYTKTSVSPHSCSPESTIRRRRFLYEGPASPTQGRIKDRVPHARDGHSSVMINDVMYVFGGDRHQMPFNDVYCYSV